MSSVKLLKVINHPNLTVAVQKIVGGGVIYLSCLDPASFSALFFGASLM